MKKFQTNLFDEIIVDNFAGGGGASTGIELATGRPVNIAINHDESAIMMHQKNHPYTEHYIEDVFQVDPKTVTRGRHVKLAWFSPDCKHFSRAKGAALVDRRIRGLAWIVLRWAGTVRPDVIMVENVPEFITWGPVRKGRPIKSKSGVTFEKWKTQLEDLGYVVEYKILCAADFGAPTIRKRFCLVARCDGKPIEFPKPTHGPADSEDVKSGKLKPWRSAAEIIDWSLPCYSIFDTKEQLKEKYGIRAVRPLKPNTMRRIAKGIDKFVIKSATPFLVECNHSGIGHTKDINGPLNTVTAKYTGGVVNPKLSPYITECCHSVGASHDLREPLNSVTTKEQYGLTGACLIQYHSEQSGKEVRGQSVDKPLQTIDTNNRYALAAMHLTQYFSGDGHYHSVTEPLATITTMEREGVTAAFLQKYYTGVDGASLKEPLPTVTAIDHNSLTFAHLAHFKGKDKGQNPNQPLMTITQGDGQFAQITTKVVKWNNETDLYYWPLVRDMLNEYCDYDLKDDEILLMNILGVWYFICDIGLRMLIPRELYSAMSFPFDYVINNYKDGSPIPRSEQVAKCGNAVCPALATAMVRANLPEWCKQNITTMQQLQNAVAW